MIPQELLLRIPGCEDGRPALSLERLAGGRGCNKVWRVESPRGMFVLRLRGGAEQVGSSSARELQAHRAAAAAGIAPALIDTAPDGRWLVMEHVAAETWSPDWLQAPARLDSLGSRLQQIHQIVPPFGHMYPGEIARDYHAAALRRGTAAASQADHEFLAIERASSQLAGTTRRAVLNHGDLQAANFLGPRPMLVDWEFAQRTDPTWDVACLLDYYPELGARLDRLLGACGLDSPEDRQILSIQQLVFASLNRLWMLGYGREAG